MNKSKFYNDWYERLWHDQDLDVYKWNRDNFQQLLKRNEIKEEFKNVLELGGGDGTHLKLYKLLFPKAIFYNCDISHQAIDNGIAGIRHFQFNVENEVFMLGFFDLIIISDLVEHLKNPELFLERVCSKARYFLIKIPIEKVLWNKINEKLGRKPKIGKKHPSGHLHEYNLNEALGLVVKYFNVIDYSKQNYCTPKIAYELCPLIFGTSLFVLAKRIE